jgi:hypothetical protein
MHPTLVKDERICFVNDASMDLTKHDVKHVVGEISGEQMV